MSARQWFSVTAAADPAEPVEVFIYDQIGEDWYGDGSSARGFIAALQQHKGRAIKLRMNSPGGVVTDGLAIYNYLKGRGNVTVTIDGYVASIATIIALAGETITIAKNGLFMIHNVSGGAWGNEKDLRQYADVLAKFNSQLVNTYVDETGNSENSVRAWMDAETWFTAEEARAAGFVDALGDASALRAHALVAGFKNPPGALRVDSAPIAGMTKQELADAAAEANNSLFTRIKALFTADPALTAKVTELEAAIAGHATALAAKDTEISNLKAAAVTAAETHTAALAAKETEVAGRVATGLTAALAKLGHIPVPTPTNPGTPDAKTKREQYNELISSGDSKAAGDFFAVNKSEIFAGK